MRPSAARWPPQPRAFHDSVGPHFGQTTIARQRQLHRLRSACPGVPWPRRLVFRDCDLHGIQLQLADAELVILGPSYGLQLRLELKPAPRAGRALSQPPSILRHSIAARQPLAISAVMDGLPIATTATPRAHKIDMPESKTVVTHSLQSTGGATRCTGLRDADATHRRQPIVATPSQRGRYACGTHPAAGFARITAAIAHATRQRLTRPPSQCRRTGPTRLRDAHLTHYAADPYCLDHRRCNATDATCSRAQRTLRISYRYAYRPAVPHAACGCRTRPMRWQHSR